MKRKREHGRILSVETRRRGDSLAADFAAGVTSITVNDAGDFDEDGGWLFVGAQTVEYTECDDDTGVITLADPLAAAAEQGDPVHVWSDLYAEVVEYQEAQVELDGDYDNPDPVVAEVAEGVGDLPEGDRGKAGESCTLLRVGDDEWEVVGVGGRSRKSRGLRFEADDFYDLQPADITAGTATFPLSHRPIEESLVAFWAGLPQRPTHYTINYDAQTITWPLSGFEQADDRLWVHYAYRKGVTTPAIAGSPVAFVGADASRGSTTANMVVPTIQAGDLLILAGFGNDGVIPSLNSPSGWTLLASATGTGGDTTAARLWYKIATGGEAAGVAIGASDVVGGTLAAYRNAKTTAPTVATQASSTTGATLTAPSVTLAADGVLLCMFGSTGGTGQSATVGTDSPLTSRAASAALYFGGAIGDQAQSAGASGSRTATSNKTTWAWAAFSVAIESA